MLVRVETESGLVGWGETYAGYFCPELVPAMVDFFKPILLGRGSSLPMLVLFMGAIGGFIMSGFIGLFVGAVVLALGYQILMARLSEAGPEAA